MYDVALVKDLLRQLIGAAETVTRRFAPIRSSEDFRASEAGREKLDAICMQLIAIGEGLKQLDRITEGVLLTGYPQIEWKRVMGMRDVLSHHYFDVDADIVFSVCESHIGPLTETLRAILAELDRTTETNEVS